MSQDIRSFFLKPRTDSKAKTNVKESPFESATASSEANAKNVRDRTSTRLASKSKRKQVISESESDGEPSVAGPVLTTTSTVDSQSKPVTPKKQKVLVAIPKRSDAKQEADIVPSSFFSKEKISQSSVSMSVAPVSDHLAASDGSIATAKHAKRRSKEKGKAPSSSSSILDKTVSSISYDTDAMDELNDADLIAVMDEIDSKYHLSAEVQNSASSPTLKEPPIIAALVSTTPPRTRASLRLNSSPEKVAMDRVAVKPSPLKAVSRKTTTPKKVQSIASNTVDANSESIPKAKPTTPQKPVVSDHLKKRKASPIEDLPAAMDLEIPSDTSPIHQKKGDTKCDLPDVIVKTPKVAKTTSIQPLSTIEDSKADALLDPVIPVAIQIKPRPQRQSQKAQHMQSLSLERPQDLVMPGLDHSL
ncbi:hypothetical protein BASA62_002301 [Batrachochytrium salamandrivorans]|nr:hypothetical protein BASA62_002301 [Batrachochytrium salamandrivorans]